MSQVTTIGLDIAKSIFQVHGVDAAGQSVLRQRLSRSRVLEFFGKLPRCLVGLEACASSHYWARELIKLGHQVRLMPAQYVKPYVGVKRGGCGGDLRGGGQADHALRWREDDRAAKHHDAASGSADPDAPAHPAFQCPAVPPG